MASKTISKYEKTQIESCTRVILEHRMRNTHAAAWPLDMLSTADMSWCNSDDLAKVRALLASHDARGVINIHDQGNYTFDFGGDESYHVHVKVPGKELKAAGYTLPPSGWPRKDVTTGTVGRLDEAMREKVRAWMQRGSKIEREMVDVSNHITELTNKLNTVNQFQVLLPMTMRIMLKHRMNPWAQGYKADGLTQKSKTRLPDEIRYSMELNEKAEQVEKTMTRLLLVPDTDRTGVYMQVNL